MTNQQEPMQAIFLRSRIELRRFKIDIVEAKTSVPVVMAKKEVAQYLAKHAMAEEGAEDYRDRLRALNEDSPEDEADVPIPVEGSSPPPKVTRISAYVRHTRYDHNPAGLRPGVWRVFKRTAVA